jgi:deoxyribodipyrimidine photo-lyase
MLAGLKGVEADLKTYNIPFIMLIGDPKEKLAATFHHLQPDAVYFDMNPLKGPRSLQQHVAEIRSLHAGVYVVDTHNVVPMLVASDKQEVGAYTLRPKIHRLFSTFMVEPEQIIAHPHEWLGRVQTLHELAPLINEVVSKLPKNNCKPALASGEKAAHARIKRFIETSLQNYGVHRNDPSLDGQSGLSAYLHFGQISALRVVLLLREASLRSGGDLHLLESPKMPQATPEISPIRYSIDALVEEMVVRKELADNFCYFSIDYSSLAAAPQWARTSLDKHQSDPREHHYSFEELEKARTHDPAWNAAQMQLIRTGKMHGYMRMYWAKKVLEWSPPKAESNVQSQTSKVAEPEVLPSTLDVRLSTLVGAEWAIEVLKYLNDHYSLDGGDPNGYAGILWSVGGVHDRPWQERDIFGVIRYMNYGGLKRKFDIETYEQQWQ